MNTLVDGLKDNGTDEAVTAALLKVAESVICPQSVIAVPLGNTRETAVSASKALDPVVAV